MLNTQAPPSETMSCLCEPEACKGIGAAQIFLVVVVAADE
jgi:hypothetical protein